MLNNLLEIVLNPETGKYYFSDFSEALVYALIGIGIVFLGIAIVVFVLWIVGIIMKKTKGIELFKKKNKVQEVQPVAESSDGEIPDEVKVAIMAAIMAYYSQENPKCEFKVKRIKRI